MAVPPRRARPLFHPRAPRRRHHHSPAPAASFIRAPAPPHRTLARDGRDPLPRLLARRAHRRRRRPQESSLHHHAARPALRRKHHRPRRHQTHPPRRRPGVRGRHHRRPLHRHRPAPPGPLLPVGNASLPARRHLAPLVRSTDVCPRTHDHRSDHPAPCPPLVPHPLHLGRHRRMGLPHVPL